MHVQAFLVQYNLTLILSNVLAQKKLPKAIGSHIRMYTFLYLIKMSKRLPDSKRNELIADFQEGKVDPDYEVIPSKTQKGKYTVRRRKVSLPVAEPQQQETSEPQQQSQEVKQGTDEEEEDEEQEFPQYNYNPYMYQDYQMMLNKMMIEQMKMMRQQMKYSNKKQQKLKGKSQRIYDLLSELAKPEPEPEEETPVKETEHEEEEEHEEAPPENTKNYFQNDYKNTQPVKEIIPEKPPVEPEPPKYKQEYEQKIDEIGGYVRFPSRRDRLNFKNFNI